MNLPNKISLTRIFMIPVFVAVFFLRSIAPYNYFIAAVLFVVASCTDFIDGYIARKHNLVTNLGKFLDPIADKVLVSTAMILLLTMKNDVFALLGSASYGVYITVAVCVCLIMARELIISAFRQIAAANGIVMAAEKLGKYKTACQDVAVFVLLLAGGFASIAFAQFPFESASWLNFAKAVTWVGLALFAVATILTVVSGVSYVVKNKQVLKDA